MRTRLVHGLEATLGPERTEQIRTAERRFRQRVADRVPLGRDQPPRLDHLT